METRKGEADAQQEEEKPAKVEDNGGAVTEENEEGEEEGEEEEEDERVEGINVVAGPEAEKAKLERAFRRLSTEKVGIRVHDILIKGNTKTKDSLIEAELEAMRDAKTVQELIRAASIANARLGSWEIFESVSITLDSGPPELPGTANVIVDVRELKNPLTGDIGVFSKPELPESPNFKVRLTLDVKQGGGTKSQFYLMDIGSCWKNDGSPCDGDVLTDVTRYSEMIINPQTPAWCSPTNLAACPPFHTTPNNTKIHRNDTVNFPYSAYHYYCGPGTARYMEKPFSTCDPYSNPQAQELVQLLPHPVWAEYGYPSKKGEGWVGDPRTWELDVGGLSSRLYFYQDPGTPAARRIWTSLDVGTEIFISDQDEIAEWTLTDFDVLIPSPPAHLNVF